MGASAPAFHWFYTSLTECSAVHTGEVTVEHTSHQNVEGEIVLVLPLGPAVVEVLVHLASTPAEYERLASRSDRFTTWEKSFGPGWVSARDGVDDVETLLILLGFEL
jgi:hypothetical protein